MVATELKTAAALTGKGGAAKLVSAAVPAALGSHATGVGLGLTLASLGPWVLLGAVAAAGVGLYFRACPLASHCDDCEDDCKHPWA